MSYTQTTVPHLVQLLNEHVTRFQFKKRDGSIRNALGTRNEVLIPKQAEVSSLEDVSNKSVVFWDLEAEAFRSFQSQAEVAIL